jgi:hypothetical protein
VIPVSGTDSRGLQRRRTQPGSRGVLCTTSEPRRKTIRLDLIVFLHSGLAIRVFGPVRLTPIIVAICQMDI